MKATFLLGRLVFGGFFLMNGINHFKQKKAMSQYAAFKNIPNPDMAVAASGLVLTVSGASMILGVKPRVGALLSIGFLASAATLFHDFWNVEDPGQKQNEMIQFSKNMALLGAALALTGVDEPWPVSLGL